MSNNTFVVGNDTYKVYFFLGRQALTMAYRVSKYFAAAIAEFAEVMLAGAQGGTKQDIDLKPCFTAFYESCSESEFLEYAGAIFDNLEINGAPAKNIWQAHFQGKPLAMFQVLFEASKVQFSDFFSELLTQERVAEARTKIQKAKLED